MPVTAMISMVSAVVLPLPRRPAVTEEHRAAGQQRAFDDGQPGGDERALAGIVRGDVAQPFVGQELHCLFDRGFRAIFPARQQRHHLLGNDKLDAALGIDVVVERQHTGIGQDDRQRGNGDDAGEGVIGAGHHVADELHRQVDGIAVGIDIIDMSLDLFCDFPLGHLVDDPLFRRR
jgi:hypothetical protein